MDGRKDRMDGWADGWIGRVNGWTDGYIDFNRVWCQEVTVEVKGLNINPVPSPLASPPPPLAPKAGGDPPLEHLIVPVPPSHPVRRNNKRVD